MLDPTDVDDAVLLEPGDAGRELGVSASRVRVMADEGELLVAARTPRGLRLFRIEDVERLRAARVEGVEAASARRSARRGRALSGPAAHRAILEPAAVRKGKGWT